MAPRKRPARAASSVPSKKQQVEKELAPEPGRPVKKEPALKFEQQTRPVVKRELSSQEPTVPMEACESASPQEEEQSESEGEPDDRPCETTTGSVERGNPDEDGQGGSGFVDEEDLIYVEAVRLSDLVAHEQRPVIPASEDGSFALHGATQLRDWIACAMQRLPAAAQCDLAHLLSCSGDVPLRVGTACSGSDAPILVVNALAGAAQRVFGMNVHYEHSFSCEMDAQKQEFLSKMFTSMRDGHDMQHLFRCTADLGRGPGGKALDILLSGAFNPDPWVSLDPEYQATIPQVDDLYMGFPCQDVSKLNPQAAEARFVIRNGDKRTGATFCDAMKYLEKANHSSTGGVTTLILENVMGLNEAPRGTDESTGMPFHSNLDYVRHALYSRGYYLLPFVLDPHDFGFPVSRNRIYMICWRLCDIYAAGFSEAEVRELATEFMQAMSCPEMRSVDDFLLPESHELVQDELRRATQLAQKRADKLLQKAKPKLKVGKCKWAITHSRALERQGKNWWESGAPPEETLQRFPGLRALTDRQIDLCNVLGVQFPDRRKSILEMSQNLRNANAVRSIPVNHVDIVTPHGAQLILHRCRFVTGLEAMLLQGLHFGENQHRAEDFRAELLRGLAGNAFNTFCFAACLIVQKAVLGRLRMQQLVKEKGQAELSRSSAACGRASTMDDLLQFDD